MTERQQNRNICVVGKAKDGMTIDASKIKIEDVSERVIGIDDSFNIEDATLLLRTSMRNAPTRIYLPSVLKGACPAFEEWADKRSVGEKLPRGRYFRMRKLGCDFMRQLNTKNEDSTFDYLRASVGGHLNPITPSFGGIAGQIARIERLTR
ncbi:hypothetical protein ACPV1J_002587 [Escherichia coli]